MAEDTSSQPTRPDTHSAQDGEGESRFMALWLAGGKLAQNFVLLGLMACAVALILRYR